MYLDGSGPAISRGLPIDKALAPETLLAFAINGEPIPALHGGPLRLVVPGYPGASFQKWIARIEVRDREHDGERMGDGHYRMPRAPLRYGEPFDSDGFEIITDMPVKSVVTRPRDGFTLGAGTPLECKAMPGAGTRRSPRSRYRSTAAVRGATPLGPLPDPFAWRRFEITLGPFPAGPVEIIARATDVKGHAQPLRMRVMESARLPQQHGPPHPRHAGVSLRRRISGARPKRRDPGIRVTPG